MERRLSIGTVAAAALALAGTAGAEVKVGVILGTTGNTASISIPYRNVYNIVPNDHNGVDARARVMVRVENGDRKLLK